MLIVTLTLPVVVAFGSLLSPAIGYAQTVRVAIFEQQSSVTISAPAGVLVKEPGDQSWSQYNRDLKVLSVPGGIQVNTQRYSVQALTIRGKAETLKVNDLWVQGSVKLIKKRGRLLVVNSVDIEEYLVGVLLGEVPSAWPLEVLKVQAIASRTYALYQKAKERYLHYDLVATTMDQVFTGAAPPNPTAFERRSRAKVVKAVNATRGQFVAFNGQPILAAFHSTAAGQTEDALQVWSEDIPYLKGVACPWDHESKFYDWTREIPVTTLEQRLRNNGHAVGIVASITPMVMTRSERVGSLRVLHSKGELVIRGEDFRKALGYTALLSTKFEIEHFGKNIVFHGKGAGHGVGLCQWGAKELAESGLNEHAILQYYYPGTVIQRLRQ
ncbi:MAG TPA: SpoIID/LytB domain-containing protein [Nitrospirales bacterium]|nr:SpoIID/LytB domain-containing protein [Nitrospirales bacterium]